MHSHHRLVAIAAVAMVAAAGLHPGIHAMEAATVGNDLASHAAMVRHLAAERADQLADIAALQSQVNLILACTAKGRFYAPGMTDADAQGCTSIEVTVIH